MNIPADDTVGKNITLEDFRKICRTCLSRDNLTPILDVMYQNAEMSVLLNDYFGIEIKNVEKMPLNICSKCLLDIIKFTDFKTLVIKNNVLLKETLIAHEAVKFETTEFENNVKFEIEQEDSTDCDDEPEYYAENVEVYGETEIIEETAETEDDYESPHNSQIVTQINTSTEEIKTDLNDDLLQKNTMLQEKNFNCPICNENFESQNDLLVHQNQKHQDTNDDTSCKVCLVKYDTQEALIIHQTKENHFVKIAFKCRECLSTFSSLQVLKYHLNETGHSPKLYSIQCEICNKVVANRSYKLHLMTHTKEKPHVCQTCGKAFSLGKNLKRHIMTHTGERPHVCEICKKGFIQAQSLHQHTKIHAPKYDSTDETETFDCDKCGRQFRRHIHYLKHLKIHTENLKDNDVKYQLDKLTEYFCSICDKGYASLKSLKVHNLSHGTKPYLCSDCGKSFTTTTILQTHRRTHTKEKPFKCKTCSKAFSHYHTLISHVAIHKNEKPYSCKHCDKSFRQAAHLKSHLRLHSGEKPYNCIYCEKSFAQRGNLKVHMRIHTGETPYVCSACGKGFYDSSSLKKHVKNHNEDEMKRNQINDELEKIDSE